MQSFQTSVVLRPCENKQINVVLEQEDMGPQPISLDIVETVAIVVEPAIDLGTSIRGCCCCRSCLCMDDRAVSITVESIPPLDPLPEIEEETPDLWLDDIVQPELTVYPN